MTLNEVVDSPSKVRKIANESLGLDRLGKELLTMNRSGFLVERKWVEDSIWKVGFEVHLLGSWGQLITIDLEE